MTNINELIDVRLLLSVGIPAVVVAAGWFVGHWLNSRRELYNRRREARLKGLETAYNRIAMASVRDWTPEHELEFEKFVAEIQLYGTPKQVNLMIEIVQTMMRHEGTVSYDALLKDLRDSLRRELRMEPLSSSVWWWRFHLPQWKKDELAKEP
jgi:hypothetical protein